MKFNTHTYAVWAVLIVALFLAANTSAQSTDLDNPTPMASTTIEGAGDGTGETVYYSFDASKGDVKITVDAKTDYYSTPLRITLLDENAKELLPIYVVAKGESQREVRTRYFVRDTKVIVRVSTQDDTAVKLLKYRIKVEGAVQFASPPIADTSGGQPATEISGGQPASESGQPSATGEPTQQSPVSETPPTSDGGQPTQPSADSAGTTKTPLKKKAKAAAKEALKKIIDF